MSEMDLLPERRNCFVVRTEGGSDTREDVLYVLCRVFKERGGFIVETVSFEGNLNHFHGRYYQSLKPARAGFND